MYIEFLDSNSSNIVYRKWVPAKLECSPNLIKISSLDNAPLYIKQMNGINSVDLVTLTGGEPAYFEIFSDNESQNISLRPKPRRFNPIKQSSDLKKIAKNININADRDLVDNKKLLKLQVISWLPVLWLIIVVIIGLFAVSN